MADRYHYLPSIGLAVMMAWGVPDLLKKWNYRKEILLTSSALSFLCLSIIAWTQVGYWQNSITLFNHTLKVTDNNWLAYNNRGFAYNGLGNYKQAIEDYDRAIEIKPAYVEAFMNRGNAYAGLGNYRQAIEDYNESIRLKADSAQTYYDRGTLYGKNSQYQLAIEDFNEAIRLKSDYADAYSNRALVYLNQGDNISGCRDARKVCELGNCKLLDAANTRGLCR